MKKAIIIGASSGIGRELAKILAREGYVLGLTARRIALLATLQQEIPSQAHIQAMDISQVEKAMETLETLIEKMGGVDLVVLSAGIGYVNPSLDWRQEKETIDVNVCGACGVINVALKEFMAQDRGHLVGISSISALRGNPMAPAYGASKAFLSHYLEGLRKWAHRKHPQIVVTDIQPGFVDTAMAKGPGLFWVESPAKAAEQIYEAIRKQKSHAYITRRWSLIGWLLWLMPRWLYDRV